MTLQYSHMLKYGMLQGFLRCFRDPIWVQIGSLESENITTGPLKLENVTIGSLESEKIGSLESDKSGTYRSIPGT